MASKTPAQTPNNSLTEPTGSSGGRALTARALVIGAVGSAILTASSLYIALKMGALPWPIVFAALASVLALRACGSHNLHEANVTHAAMSAGSMVAGGLAFTIPGMWMLGGGAQVSLGQVLTASLAGTVLGLVACAALQPYFIRERKLAYPIGMSAAETLKACASTGGSDGKVLFGGMGLAAIWALLRDVAGVMPSLLLGNITIPGVAFGIYNSPMMLAMGFTVGILPVAVWFLGSLIGSFGIAFGLPAAGLTDAVTAANIQSSLGLGLMLGVGAGLIVRGLAPVVKGARARKAAGTDATAATSADAANDADEARRRLVTPVGAVALISAAVVCVGCLSLGLELIPSVALVIGAWFAVYLSAWLTGTTGINPMEIFGVLVLLVVQLLSHHATIETLFLAAAVTAVACGICGDVMNDLKAGDMLDTDPRDQFTGMCVGGLVGAIVASLLLIALFETYGPGAFGTSGDGTFVAAQASVVAAMAGGIPHVPAFCVGLIAGFVMALAGLPVMTLGLGVYLPFYISAGAGVGALVRIIFDKLHANASDAEKAADEAQGQALAAGILGGESLVGVIVAILGFVGMLAG